ncbi:insulin-like growth factor-binding protein 6 [Eucyclogobius newberryi]|uniref:insulin-like growth factor-binding protein 6 n=1 Tax=Eucyclogobius newberryi TaxID=166745 RepID=UPI003B5BF68C
MAMWYFTFLTLLLLEPLDSLQSSVRVTPAEPSAEARTLAAGEPCGVYTLKCVPGLKCVPPNGDHTPLRTLLDGRGRCGNNSGTAPSRTDTAPTKAPEEAPCRKRLNTLLSASGPLPFGPGQEIYLPNCSRDGFYKRKQCWSSKRRQRGKCWCVDENGTPLNPNSTRKSSSRTC